MIISMLCNHQALASNLGQQQDHVVNPFHHAQQYINPDYSKEIEFSLQKTTDPKLHAQMRTLQHISTAIWLDRIAAIKGGVHNNHRLSLEQHFLHALAQKNKDIPILVPIVLYNLPNRDCSALSSNGTLDFRTGGMKAYQHDFIDPIVKLTQDPRFHALHFVFIVEPDSLPNMVTNLWHDTCDMVKKNHVYEKSIQYAIQQLSQSTNNYIYMDIGHSGWLGWDENIKKTVQLFKDVLINIHSPRGLQIIDGFVTNTSGFTPVEEPILNDPNISIGGKPIKSAIFYGWNSNMDEKHFVTSLYQAFIQEGFSTQLKFLIDTSRNGWGARRHAIFDTDDVNHYVEQNRIDRRFHRGNWCNPSDAGLGMRPIAEPFGKTDPIAAFVWIKPPGESDGSSNPTQNKTDSEGKHFDKMCDPHYIVNIGPNPSKKPTGALSNAPASGHWFHQQFIMLINNAYPPISTSNNGTH